MMPSKLLFLVAGLLSTASADHDEHLGKMITTEYVKFGTYNADSITAWGVMQWEAEASSAVGPPYKDFLSAMLASVWTEKMASEISVRVGDDKFKGVIRLIDSPLVFGTDVDCPDPPGWIPPRPAGRYTCQEFKAALKIEVDKDAVAPHGGYSAEETYLAVGAHVQQMYREATKDGTMERRLRDIESGKGAIRILWDDPALRTAWARLDSPDDGGGDAGPNVRAIVGGTIVGFVMLFFCCSVCVGGRMGRGYPKDMAKKIMVPKVALKKSSGTKEQQDGLLSDVDLSESPTNETDPESPTASRTQPPPPHDPDSPEADRAFDLPSIE